MFHYQQKLAYLKKPSDVILVIENVKFSAHRSILSEKSEYFKQMFSNSSINSESDSVVLEETNLGAFVVVLLFIYSGDIYGLRNRYTTTENFEILTCARKYMVYALVQKILDNIEMDCVSPKLLLNKALVYHENGLIFYSTNAILATLSDKKPEIFFKELAPVAVEHFLKQSLTLRHKQMVYPALVSWIRSNTDYSNLFPELLKLVDLSSLEVKHITKLLESGCIGQSDIQQKMRAAKALKDKNGHLYLNKELSDVTFIIDGTELPAHRSILSERSEYFKTMFSSSFIEANSNKITLKETNLNAFKAVLNYIYTGSMNTSKNRYNLTLELALEILACARYYMMEDLTKDTTLLIICAFNCTPLQLLKYGFKYFADDLITYGTDSFLETATLYKETDFKELSPLAMEHLLKQPLNLIQTQIMYEALVYWVPSNPMYSYLFPDLLKHIDLSSFDVKYVSKLLEPANIGGCQQKMRIVKMLNDKNGHLYLSEELSDVTLVIDGTELPAHRSILSERSEYFNAMFSKNLTDSDCKKITLNNMNVNAFKPVLKYIYTGSIYNSEVKNLFTLDETFYLLACAQYCKIDALVKEMALILICIKRCTPVRLLNFGIEYYVDDLISYGTDRMKENASH